MKVTAVLNAAQGSMEDWNYVNTGPAYYQAVGMGMYGQANSSTPFAIPNPQISLVYKSANRKSTNFLDYSANRKSANYLKIIHSAKLCLKTVLKAKSCIFKTTF
jgi:hypothetical protein